MESAQNDANAADKMSKELIKRFFEESRKNRLQKYIRMGITLGILLFIFVYMRPPQEVRERDEHPREKIADFVKPAGTIERVPFKAIAGSAPEKNKAHIALVPLQGVITGSTNAGSAEMITERYVRDMLAHVKTDSAVRAVVFFIESPGGALIPTDNIYNLIRTFSGETPNTVVIAYVGSMAASGGYYLALAADLIIAHPLALVGNIGAVMQRPDVSALAERFGVKMHTFKSGRFKDMGNPFAAASKEEIAIFDGLIAEGLEIFTTRVMESRGAKIDRKKLTTIFDGRIFSANSALQLGLIDQTAYLDDLFEHVADALGRNSYSQFYVYRYKMKKSTWEQFFASANTFVQHIFSKSGQQAPYVSLE